MYLQNRFPSCGWTDIETYGNGLWFVDHGRLISVGTLYVEPEDVKNCGSYPMFINRIAIDRADCFNKWSQVSLSLPIPETRDQFNYLKSMIDWLLTDDGYNFSMDWNTIDNYPLEIRKYYA